MVNTEGKNEESNSQPDDSESGMNKKESTHGIVDVEPITITAVAMDAVHYQVVPFQSTSPFILLDVIGSS